MTTVREIIEQLQKFPQDTIFLINNREYGVHGADEEYPIQVQSGTYAIVDYGDSGREYICGEINYDGEGGVVKSQQNCVYIDGD